MIDEPDRVDTEVNAVTAVTLRIFIGFRNLPFDLAVMGGVTLATIVAVVTPVIRETPLRILFGLPFVLFVPGYVFVAALFPEANSTLGGEEPDIADETGTSQSGEDSERIGPIGGRGIDGIERVALSFGLSIAIVPLIGLALNFTPWGIRLGPILISIAGFTLISISVAAIRRWELPPEKRFRVPYNRYLASGRDELFNPDTRADAILNGVLALSIVLAVSSVGYAVMVPQQGESFTELYLLTETDDGELVADEYPTEFVRGEERSLVVGVANHEHEPTNYTLLVMLQRVQTTNNSTTVLKSDQLHRFNIRLTHNETWQRQHAISPTFTGEDLRLAYLLYRGSPPSSPSIETSYREVHLWVNVTSSATNG